MDFDITADPRYIAWQERSLDLQRQRNALTEQLGAAEARRAASRDPSTVHAQAVALLDGEDVPEATDTAAEIRALQRRLQVVEAAGKLSDERRQEVVASVVKDWKPALREGYLGILGEMVPLVRALGALAAKEAAYREDLQRGGVPFTGAFAATPFRHVRVGGPEESAADRWLREIARDFPELADS